MSEITVLNDSGKLRLETEGAGDSVILRPIGVIDEDTDFATVFDLFKDASAIPKLIEIDLGKIYRINSSGVRHWLELMERLSVKTKCVFSNINEIMVEEANIIPGILGTRDATVLSFQAPYRCNSCDHETSRLLKPDQIQFNADTPVMPKFKCEKCGNPLEFNSIEEEYFFFLRK